MLQRIQSVFLALVFVFALLFLFLPLGTFDPKGLGLVLKVSGLELPADAPFEYNRGWYGYVLMVLALGIMVLTAFTISQFKRRMYQIQLGKFNVLLHVGLIVTAFFFVDQLRDSLLNLPFTYGPAVFLPLASMVLVLIANKAIRKDERLVRAADRIR